jgi:hypothetical protein
MSVKEERGSSPASRGGAGVYIEGELGAFYLLNLLAGASPRGLPRSQLSGVTFQGTDSGYALDDLILHGNMAEYACLLEIQSKRTVSFAPKDAVFKEVCEQIARSDGANVVEEYHFLAVATQRTSRSISGPYQEALQWAKAAQTSTEFFGRLAAHGVASKSMREFTSTFRNNLVAAGVANDDDAIWRYLRRFLILEFDFEATSSLARTHALTLARQVLSNQDLTRAESLWGNLVDISLATAKVGGTVDRQTLSKELAERGFHLTGYQDFALARERLAEMTCLAIANIGNSLSGMQLPRLDIITSAEEALDKHRLVAIQGEPGTGKSWVLRHLAERTLRESHVILLDPTGTPEGGWPALAQSIGVTGTARAFLNDLAASGGGILFIDSLEMFTSPGIQRTVNDLLRAVSDIPGFSVITTSRPEFDQDSDPWLAEDAIAALGAPQTVMVEELSDDEAEMLRKNVPELHELLAPTHPAARIARNPYRLSRLLKVKNPASIRTEASLAAHWWQTADGARREDIRSAQRLLSDLAETALKGENTLELRSDSGARTHLLSSLTLRETKRDNLAFYHDVLRDWAVGNRINEDPTFLKEVDLSAPVSPRLARGIELAGRLRLELNNSETPWLELLNTLAASRSHSSWRRQALMAIVRSERGPELLEQCSTALLARGGALFRDAATSVISVETVATADLLRDVKEVSSLPTVPASMRSSSTRSALDLLLWSISHASEIPLQAIGAALKLIEIQYLTLMAMPELAQSTARMLFNWLLQLDTDIVDCKIPHDKQAAGFDQRARTRLIEDLRTSSLLFANQTPDDAKAYLRSVTAERGQYKVKAIRLFSRVLAQAAPAEFAALISNSLIEKRKRCSKYEPLDRQAFSFLDSDYLPASPSQTPFLDILENAPQTGLALIWQLTDEAVAFRTRGTDKPSNGFTLELHDGTRFFPWKETYLWSRDQATEYSVASALKALEAWGHSRLDAGDSVETVIPDILGPKGNCAAFVLVAVDLLLSHWPASRDALVPFLTCPELLAIDHGRAIHDQIDRFQDLFGQEPAGKVQLADLAARPSRRISLEHALTGFLDNEPVVNRLRTQLKAAVESLEVYDENATFDDPAFMGNHALNLLDQKNWVNVEHGMAYQSPPTERKHLERLKKLSSAQVEASEVEAKIQLAINDPAKGSPELALEFVEYADGALPDGSDPDVLNTRSTRLVSTAMLVARDGDDDLLDSHETWIRSVVNSELTRDKRLHSGSGDLLEFNLPALATCALIYLWARKKQPVDRDELVRIATRTDKTVSIAFARALEKILTTDPRLLKAVMRAAFGSSRWRKSTWGEDAGEQERFQHEKADADARAIAAEIAWLDGGTEPEWPTFPCERPPAKTGIHLKLPGADATKEENSLIESDSAPAGEDPSVHTDVQGAARWLRVISEHSESTLDWGGEIVDAYALWTARMNGYGLPMDAQIDDGQSNWNEQFYSLLARALMDMPPQRFEHELSFITSLPDESFGAVTEILLHTADVVYFNDSQQPSDRAVELRAQMVQRTMTLRGWRHRRPPSDLSVDYEMGGIVAKLFMNTHNPFTGTKSYLVPAVFDRVDPLLEPLRPILSGGPTPFIALCTMNMLLVAPSGRHIDFLLSATEAWFEYSAGDPTLWEELGIGRKIFEWFEHASTLDPLLLNGEHPLRDRIDTMLGRLVEFGVPEAYELEQRIERP